MNGLQLNDNDNYIRLVLIQHNNNNNNNKKKKKKKKKKNRSLYRAYTNCPKRLTIHTFDKK